MSYSVWMGQNEGAQLYVTSPQPSQLDSRGLSKPSVQIPVGLSSLHGFLPSVEQ